MPGYVGAVEHSQSESRSPGTRNDNVEHTNSAPALQEMDFGILGTSGFSVGAFLYSPAAVHNHEGVPDIQVTVCTPSCPEAFTAQLGGGGGEHRRKGELKSGSSAYITVAVSLLHSESRNRVTLNQTTPATPALPVLEPESEGNALLSDGDISCLGWALKQARSILNSAPINAHVVHEDAPGAHVQTDDSLAEYIKSTAVAANNWCGSAEYGHRRRPFKCTRRKFKSTWCPRFASGR